MKLGIADPPYPPRARRRQRDAGDVVKRASRWYGQMHPDAADWDDPTRHRALMAELMERYDGWAIATTPDGLAAYGELPPGATIMAWVRLNGMPGGSRIRSCWEAVIAYPARPARVRGQIVPDVLVKGSPRTGFPGAKPPEWTRWVLDALGYDPDLDTVDDLFPGSGAVGAAAEVYMSQLELLS